MASPSVNASSNASPHPESEELIREIMNNIDAISALRRQGVVTEEQFNGVSGDFDSEMEK